MTGSDDSVDGDRKAEPIERAALARISPDPALLARVSKAGADLVARASEAAGRRHSPMVRCLVAGSAARGTFLVDRLDIDFFMLFPPSLDREGLEREGMAIARELLEAPETRYAEHPYLRGTFERFAVDAVPGYAIDDPSHPLSAVDRTPFHQRYLQARSTPALVGEIRLAKQFLRALGAYGSEARTGGFSGYLVELLVVRFGSLRALLRQAEHWRIPVHLPTDPAARPRVPADVALILDDPVDPNRNVATALSWRNLGLLILGSAAYLAEPDPRFFEVHPSRVLTLASSRQRLAERGTHVTVLTLPRPKLVDDILYPQLRKAERTLSEASARLGYTVLGSASGAGPSHLVVLVEVDHAELPKVRVHEGPPAGIDRGSEFLAKWTAPAAPVLQGPYLTEAGKLAVDTRRAERGIEPLLTAELSRLPIGKDLKDGVGPSTALRPLSDVSSSPELLAALGDLLDRRLPWLRAPPD
ncbi:MAG: CCA tRNA nucleotidyltransferase [Thermoplasmata archaeon]|nr:CCA tRNA nucleotidyltransferase [Thermoplasmata archaeon]MCI4359177.1 CCA tRNA nucleotidyltransferase [Thermoplasmata archaeon]